MKAFKAKLFENKMKYIKHFSSMLSIQKVQVDLQHLICY